jgi:DNA-binding MarR family transcriptional regulator
MKAPADADESLASGVDTFLWSLFGFQLRRAHTLFALHWQLGFRDQPIHVTPTQGGMLLVIEDRPGLTQTELARVMDVQRPTLLQALTKLEEAKLVKLTRQSSDRRSTALHLTAAGHRAVGLVKGFVPYREDDMLVDLSAAERLQLQTLLRRVVRRGQIVTTAMTERQRSTAEGRPARSQKARKATRTSGPPIRKLKATST